MRWHTVFILATTSFLSWACRGKEGPAGPPGRDLSRPQQGFVEGTARGKDEAGNPFDIRFRYTYYPQNSGTWRVVSGSVRELTFTRQDSLGIGSITFTLRYDASNNQVTVTGLSGVAADISQKPVPTHSFQIIPRLDTTIFGFPIRVPGTTQEVSDFTFSGDNIQGKFRFIRPQYERPSGLPPQAANLLPPNNQHPDTIVGSFSISLTEVRPFNRTTP
ncbi:MAG: hypothetical protein NZ958_07440 [Bacteroidia bacterium]|nr:hypothetical protein [Bacteroidia bacterium]MDW8088683.1 hypothetical protein [Bacteroidia bacterium]